MQVDVDHLIDFTWHLCYLLSIELFKYFLFEFFGVLMASFCLFLAFAVYAINNALIACF